MSTRCVHGPQKGASSGKGAISLAWQRATGTYIACLAPDFSPRLRLKHLEQLSRLTIPPNPGFITMDWMGGPETIGQNVIPTFDYI